MKKKKYEKCKKNMKKYEEKKTKIRGKRKR